MFLIKNFFNTGFALKFFIQYLFLELFSILFYTLINLLFFCIGFSSLWYWVEINLIVFLSFILCYILLAPLDLLNASKYISCWRVALPLLLLIQVFKPLLKHLQLISKLLPLLINIWDVHIRLFLFLTFQAILGFFTDWACFSIMILYLFWYLAFLVWYCICYLYMLYWRNYDVFCPRGFLYHLVNWL